MVLKKKKKTSNLGQRELLLIKLVCQEKSNLQIAEKLGLSLRQTEKIKTGVYRKTKVKSMIGLFKWALLHGHYKLRGLNSKDIKA